jgi:hypothetical protein
MLRRAGGRTLRLDTGRVEADALLAIGLINTDSYSVDRGESGWGESAEEDELRVHGRIYMYGVQRGMANIRTVPRVESRREETSRRDTPCDRGQNAKLAAPKDAWHPALCASSRATSGKQ